MLSFNPRTKIGSINPQSIKYALSRFMQKRMTAILVLILSALVVEFATVMTGIWKIQTAGEIVTFGSVALVTFTLYLLHVVWTFMSDSYQHSNGAIFSSMRLHSVFVGTVGAIVILWCLSQMVAQYPGMAKMPFMLAVFVGLTNIVIVAVFVLVVILGFLMYRYAQERQARTLRIEFTKK